MQKKGVLKLAATGAVIGMIAVILVLLGNPKNMGFCIACFVRDTAGAVGLHRAEAVQYIRPEIIGLVIGAFLMSAIKGEFSARGGSSPFVRLVLGFFVMTSALVFLGCPFRMVLRMAGGDLNAWIGLVGFAAGIGAGSFFLNKGYSLKRTYKLPAADGAGLVVVQVVLFVLLLAAPAFIFFSEKGPGSMHAPIVISLIAGLVVGALAQRTRFCMAGGIRDVFLFRDFTLLSGFIAMFVAALIVNLILNATQGGGFFQMSFASQPIAHSDGLWNFLSMAAVGLGSVMLGGCPMRQLILSGEGNSDSALTVVGLFLGAAFAHNFGLASAAETVKDGVVSGGPTAAGKIVVIVALVVMVAIACISIQKESSRKTKEVA